MATSPYSFKNDIVLSVNFAPLSGFGDGDDVIMFTPKEDRVTTRVGADGFATPALNANQLWDITIKLMDTAANNSILAALEQAQNIGSFVVFPILMKDMAGTDLFQSSKCWITKHPAVQYGTGANIREWGLEANDATAFFGGHI